MQSCKKISECLLAVEVLERNKDAPLPSRVVSVSERKPWQKKSRSDKMKDYVESDAQHFFTRIVHLLN